MLSQVEHEAASQKQEIERLQANTQSLARQTEEDRERFRLIYEQREESFGYERESALSRLGEESQTIDTLAASQSDYEAIIRTNEERIMYLQSELGDSGGRVSELESALQHANAKLTENAKLMGQYAGNRADEISDLREELDELRNRCAGLEIL